MFGNLAPAELATSVAVLIGALLLLAFPAGRICTRLGFSPWLGLLAVVPVANLGLLWFVALAKWPGADSSVARN